MPYCDTPAAIASWISLVLSLLMMQSRMKGVAIITSQAGTRPWPSARGMRRIETTAFSTPGELQADLLLLVRGEDRDDAVDGLRRVEGVQRRQHQVAGLGRGDRGLDRLVVAHLADQDHVGVLSQRAPERGGEAPGVDLHLALVDDRLLVAVQELDRVLDRDDVLAALGVDVVDHRGERRRLARAGGAGAQDQPALLVRDALEHDRQPELAHGHDLDRDDAQHQADRAALLENVAAEAAEPGHGVRDVDLEVLLELLLLAVAHDGERHRDGVLLHEALGLDERNQLAVDAQHRVRPHLQVEVGGLALRRHLQQVVDVHRSPRSGPTAPRPTPLRPGRARTSASRARRRYDTR